MKNAILEDFDPGGARFEVGRVGTRGQRQALHIHVATLHNRSALGANGAAEIRREFDSKIPGEFFHSLS